MKKLFVLLLVLVPFAVIAANNIEAGGLPSSNCDNFADAKARKECLATEKRVQANESFKNFSESNKNPYQEKF